MGPSVSELKRPSTGRPHLTDGETKAQRGCEHREWDPGPPPRYQADSLASAQRHLQGQLPATCGVGGGEPLGHLKLANRLLAGDLQPENGATPQMHTKGVGPPTLSCPGLTHSATYCPAFLAPTKAQGHRHSASKTSLAEGPTPTPTPTPAVPARR